MDTTDIGYSAGGKAFAGVLFSNPAGKAPRPGVLVLHGGAGVTDHERERARELAALGYVTYVPDLFGERFADRAHGTAAILRLVRDPADLRARVQGALGCLREQPGVDPGRTGAIGFCFGGLAALELARSGTDVGAVVSFHGGLQTCAPARAGEISSKLLVCTGGADPFVPREQRASFEDEMSGARADWQMHVYGGAMHGFTERAIHATPRPGCAYDEAADRRSWHAMRTLFVEALG